MTASKGGVKSIPEAASARGHAPTELLEGCLELPLFTGLPRREFLGNYLDHSHYLGGGSLCILPLTSLLLLLSLSGLLGEEEETGDLSHKDM